MEVGDQRADVTAAVGRRHLVLHLQPVHVTLHAFRPLRVVALVHAVDAAARGRVWMLGCDSRNSPIDGSYVKPFAVARRVHRASWSCRTGCSRRTAGAGPPAGSPRPCRDPCARCAEGSRRSFRCSRSRRCSTTRRAGRSSRRTCRRAPSGIGTMPSSSSDATTASCPVEPRTFMIVSWAKTSSF